MNTTNNSDFSKLLKYYLNETKKFDKEILFSLFSFIGKQNITDEHLIASIINHESKQEYKIRELISSDSETQQYNIKEL